MHTKQSLAKYFGVSLSTIHRLAAQGKIETIKVGRSVRITDQAVARFIKSNGSAL
ncbi:helix-turn-helix domain-containing protein [Aquiluna sp.]|nr:helix-turn-helix domain-containing protein [Aquiluna sp.]